METTQDLDELDKKPRAPSLADGVLCDISRLPPEILSAIFVLAREDSSPRMSLMALIISHVSRQWRELSLSLSALWTVIDTSNVEFIHTMMTRAGAQFLRVDLYLAVVDRRPLDMVLTALHRIQDLRVQFLFPEYGYLALKLEKFPQMSGIATSLKSLQLTTFDLATKDLFSGHLPSLHHLYLQDCTFDWDALPDCPQLRSLDITYPHSNISLSSFLQRLLTFPHLESLTMMGALNNNSVANANHLSTRVELLKLKHFHIDGNSVAAILFALQNIFVARTCNIGLTNIKQEHRDEYLALFPTLNTSRNGTVGAIKKIAIVVSDCLTVVLIEDHQHTRAQPVKIETSFWLPSLSTSSTLMEMATRTLESCFDLSCIEILDLQGDDVEYSLPHSFWGLIDSLSNLRTLKVRISYAQSFHEYISQEPVTDGSWLPFKSIHKLVYEDPAYLEEEYSQRFPSIENYLRRRMSFGSVLDTLTLVAESRIPDHRFEGFLGLVRELKRKLKTMECGKAVLV